MQSHQQNSAVPSRLGSPEVQCLASAVRVDNLFSSDRTVADFYPSLPSDRRGPTALDAFNLGTRALASAAASATMASLNDHLDSAVQKTSQNIAALPSTVNKHIETICQQYLGENGVFIRKLGADLQSLEDTLKVDGAVAKQLREAVAAEVRRRVNDALDPLVKALNVNDANGPLGLVNANLQAILHAQGQLQEQIKGAVQVQAVRAVSVHKGYALEAWIEDVLGPIASSAADRFEDCSRAAGYVPGCKDGDFVSQIDPALCPKSDLRISVEAKNRKTASVAALCALLESVKGNRGATVCIGVLTNPNIKTRPIAIYGRDKIIVHLPDFGTPSADEEQQRTLLEMAYYVARTQALAIQGGDSATVLSSPDLEAYLEHLERSVDDFRRLNRNLSAIESAVATTRDTANNIRDGLRHLSSEMKEALAIGSTAALSLPA